MEKSRFPGTAGVLAVMRDAHSPENAGGAGGDGWKRGGQAGWKPAFPGIRALRAHAEADAGIPEEGQTVRQA